MKPLIMSLMAINVLAGCTVQTRAARNVAIPTVSATANQSTSKLSSSETIGFATSALTEDRYEVTYLGSWPGSRDEIEGRLLYRAALVARQQGKTWFRFLHLPGEDGPLSHPSRPSAAFGAAFTHWQPHWNYWTTWGWQLWHPERGHPFWGDTVDGRGVEKVEVHAMIELGTGPFAAAEPTDFDVSAVLRDVPPALR